MNGWSSQGTSSRTFQYKKTHGCSENQTNKQEFDELFIRIMNEWPMLRDAVIANKTIKNVNTVVLLNHTFISKEILGSYKWFFWFSYKEIQSHFKGDTANRNYISTDILVNMLLSFRLLYHATLIESLRKNFVAFFKVELRHQSSSVHWKQHLSTIK